MIRSSVLPLFFLVVFAKAAQADPFQVPRHFLQGRSDWTFQTLAETCFSMQTRASGVPCNPAIAASQDSHVGVFVFLGHNVDRVADLHKVLDGNADIPTVKRLIRQDRPDEINGQAEFNWVHESWSLAFIPYRLNYHSEVRNKALTYISLYGNLENSFIAQKSFAVGEDLRLGVQLQALHRRFVLSDFFLTDVLVEGGSDRYLPVQTQNALGLTPGLTWNLEKHFNYKPQVSLAVTQLEAVDHPYDGFPRKPEIQLGTSIEPEFSEGTAEFGAHLRFPLEKEESSQVFRLAAAFTQEKNTWAASANLNQLDIGFHHQFSALNAGAVLDLQKVENIRGTDESLTTIYFNLGAEI